jgi:hypothetical protein
VGECWATRSAERLGRRRSAEGMRVFRHAGPACLRSSWPFIIRERLLRSGSEWERQRCPRGALPCVDPVATGGGDGNSDSCTS